MTHDEICKLPGTRFQHDVWCALSSIPRGRVRTYTQLAHDIGRPTSARAVANACGANPMIIDIPCHRAIGTNGKLGGYSGTGGIDEKRQLLKNEGIDINRLSDFLY